MAEFNVINVRNLPQNQQGILAARSTINQRSSLEYNYIVNTGIDNHYRTNLNLFPNVNPMLLLQDENNHVNFLNLVNLIEPGRTLTVRSAYVEFLQFIEVQVHNIIRESVSNLAVDRPTMINLIKSMSTSDNLTRVLRNGIRNVNYLSADFKYLMNNIISKIANSYRNSDILSKFLSQFSILEIPVNADNEVRWFHRLSKTPQYMPGLKILIQILLLRFPSIEIDENEEGRTIGMTIWMKKRDENEVRFVRERVNFKIYDKNNSSVIFYYLPKIQRVVGIWNKVLQLKNQSGPSGRVNFNLNYRYNLLRNYIYYIENVDGAIPDFARFFSNPVNNIYYNLRTQNPFGFFPLEPRTRLYVTLSIYGKQNRPLYYIPWVLEGSLSSGISYDISNFINEYNYQLETEYGGNLLSDDEKFDNDVFYFHFTLLLDNTKIDTSESQRQEQRPIQNQIRDIDDDVEIIPDDFNPDRENEPARPRRRIVNRRPAPQPRPAPPPPQPAPVRGPRNNRGSRELRSLGVTLPTNTRQTRSSTRNNVRTTRSGLRLGAPYIGTKKEKHLFEASVINKFTNSPALFKTPETYLHCCLLMSLIRAQLYCYTFEDNKCKDLKITGTNHSPSKCKNMYIEAINNYDDKPKNYSFLEKIEGKWYIKLFEPGKIKKDDNLYVEGVVDDVETDFWLTASEEVLFHLEQYFKKEIDYNDIDDLCQCFSDFFKVCISIYDIETRASRVHVYRPFNLTPREIVSRYNCLLMIHIVYDQGHAHAISNFPAFIKKDTRKDSLRLYNYCPICEKQQIKELRTTSEESFKHITHCCKKDFVIKKESMIDEMIMMNSEKVKIQYKKINNKTKIVHQCTQCYCEIEQRDWMKHDCYIRKKKVNNLEESKIYVYDLEACQITDSLGLLKHECNCLFIRKVYCENEDEEKGVYFPGEFEFIDDLIKTRKYENCTFIAHNGGSYDIHFLLRILERCEIVHSFVPSPTSKHKFIQITITHDDLNIRFIDFMRFIPGSLKNIAAAFEIPVSKGDFPHRFNNGEHDNYIGRIPPLYTNDDWWSLKYSKNEKDKNNFLKWYNEQSLIYCTCDNDCNCDKLKWDFQEEIKKYCLLDVVVLAEIVKAYRNACMNFDVIDEKMLNWSAPRIDPLQFMTLPQITISTFVNGFETMDNPNYDFSGVYTLNNVHRGGKLNQAITWIYNLQLQQKEKIYYLGNSMKEWYDFDLNMHFDGYCEETDTVYLYLDCMYWGCPQCMHDFHELNEKIPLRGMYASDVKDQFQRLMFELNSKYTNIIYIWHHDYNEPVNDYLNECSHLFEPEDCFYGGRCEVFKPFYKPRENEQIHYYDVTSLYPSVYAHHVLPLGKPIHLIGDNIEKIRLHPTHPNRYYGFVKCYVIPNKKDLLGLLPKRDEETGRLFFPVNPMIGCWYTTEIYLAMQNGYEVTEIYEIYHWDERNRSDQHIKPYVDYFFRMKQEAEGWKKLGASCDEPTEEEKDQIVERLYQQNGQLGRIRKDKVKLNPVLRALAKLYLNSFWGKLAQKRSKSCHMTVYGSQQLLDLINNPFVLMQSCKFREISVGVYKVSFNIKEEYLPSVKHGNLFIGAAVTATARCVLHSKMISIGPKKIIYCDTDSIVFVYLAIMGVLTDIGLGKWTNEYPKHLILQFYGLAPKLYSLLLQEINNEDSTYESFRTKGIQLTLENKKKMAFENIKPLLQQLITGETSNYIVEVDNMNIFTNSTNNALPFGQVYTRYNKKQVRGLITKRYLEVESEVDWEVVNEIQTYPFGYDNN